MSLLRLPNPAPGRGQIRLSPWDEPLVGAAFGKVYFYAGQLDVEGVCASLKQTLQGAPGLGGRLVQRKGCKLAIGFENPWGVSVEVKTRKGPLKVDPWQARPCIKGLVPPLFWPAVNRDRPLLQVRITQYEEGGSALGLAYNHGVVDGGGARLFEKRWLSIARGQTPAPVGEERALIFGECGGAAPALSGSHGGQHSSFFRTPPWWRLAKDRLGLVLGLARANSLLVHCDVGRLRTLGESWREAAGERLSSKDVFSGLVVAAIGLEPRTDGSLRCSAVLDMRNRASHAAPQTYSGNFCLAPLVKAAERTDAPLAARWARGFRAAISGMAPETIARDVCERARHPPGRIWPIGLDVCLGKGLMQDSWADPSAYDFDLGAGAPLWLDAPDILPNGLLLLLPDPARKGDVWAVVRLDGPRMGRFQQMAQGASPSERGRALVDWASR